MAQVTPTRTKSPEEVDRGKEALAVEAAAVAEVIAEIVQLLNICLKKKKDCCVSKLIITKTGHQATQYKNIFDTLSVL